VNVSVRRLRVRISGCRTERRAVNDTDSRQLAGAVPSTDRLLCTELGPPSRAAAVAMSEREEADDVSAVEKMSTADRLKAARKKRLAQLKKYHQYERQLEKENNRKSAAASSGGRKKATTTTTTKPARRQRTAPRVQFVSNVVLLEAAARNDVIEGNITELISRFDSRHDETHKPHDATSSDETSVC